MELTLTNLKIHVYWDVIITNCFKSVGPWKNWYKKQRVMVFWSFKNIFKHLKKIQEKKTIKTNLHVLVSGCLKNSCSKSIRPWKNNFGPLP